MTDEKFILNRPRIWWLRKVRPIEWGTRLFWVYFVLPFVLVGVLYALVPIIGVIALIYGWAFGLHPNVSHVLWSNFSNNHTNLYKYTPTWFIHIIRIPLIFFPTAMILDGVFCLTFRKVERWLWSSSSS